MEISSAWISCFVAGLPMPLYAGMGACCAAAVDAITDIQATNTIILENRILYAPVRIHFPWLNRIHVARDQRSLLEKIRIRAPNLGHLRERWLHDSIVVRAAGHEHGLTAVPIPRNRKSRVGLAQNRVL